MNTWIKGGCPPSKLVLGLGMYGRTFTLKRKRNAKTKPYGPSRGAGLPGNYTGSHGFLAYYEICQLITKQQWHTEYDREQQVPYAYKKDQWVSYDNQQSIAQKCHYVAKNHLAGAMIWSLDFDDFNGAFCGQGKYPLLKTVKRTLDNLQGPIKTIGIHKTTQITMINHGYSYSYSILLFLIDLLIPIFNYHFIR